MKSLLSVTDFKKLLDTKAQEAIITVLSTYGVSANLISEEGNAVFRNGEYTIITDPLDGTTNMARGLPPAVTAILVSETDYLSGAIASLIVNLFTGETYGALMSNGAFLNSEPIKTAEYKALKNSLISMDLSKKPMLAKTSSLLKTCRYLRMLGCSAMSLCKVADGTLDAHVDIRGTLRNTDVAAALMILIEAGGVYAINGQKGLDLDISKIKNIELLTSSSDDLLNEIIDIIG